jgi:hypothetical protein
MHFQRSSQYRHYPEDSRVLQSNHHQLQQQELLHQTIRQHMQRSLQNPQENAPALRSNQQPQEQQHSFTKFQHKGKPHNNEL